MKIWSAVDFQFKVLDFQSKTYACIGKPNKKKIIGTPSKNMYRKPDAAAKRLVLLHKADGVVRVKSLKKAGLEDHGLNHR